MPYKNPDDRKAWEMRKKDHLSEYKRQWSADNKERLNQKCKTRYLSDEDYKTRRKNYVRKSQAKERKLLADTYVRRLLVDRCEALRWKDIPIELIELKRAILALKREIA